MLNTSSVRSTFPSICVKDETDLLLIPVGIFIGMGAEDYRTYSLTFIFYLVLAPAISGVLNKIMYISESFTQIDGNVERMEEVLSIPVLQN